MKKLLPIMMVLVFATTVFAQKGSVTIENPNPQSRSNEYVCATGSVFSQIGADAFSATFCQKGYLYYQCGDDYTASGPFSTMRFWGTDLYGCTLNATESFDIFIYDDDPSSTGMIVHSFTLDGATTLIGPIPHWSPNNIYQIDIDFGMTINQLSGWIVISRNAPSCDNTFGWMSFPGGNSVSTNGTWEPSNMFLYFCLGGDPPVPLSNWSIYGVILLIGAFIVIRYRRKLAIG